MPADLVSLEVTVVVTGDIIKHFLATGIQGSSCVLLLQTCGDGSTIRRAEVDRELPVCDRGSGWWVAGYGWRI